MFTENKEDIDYVMNNFNFGGMSVNDTMTHLANSRLPFGGVRESGIRRYHGFEGFKAFSHKTSVFSNKFSPDFNLRYPPYGKFIKNMMNKK